MFKLFETPAQTGIIGLISVNFNDRLSYAQVFA